MKKLFKKIVAFALVLCFGISLVACGDNSLSQKETEEYTAKVTTSIDLVSGYTFSGAIKATATTHTGNGADTGTSEVEVSGYVYATGNRLVDLTLLATVVSQDEDYEYNDETNEYEEVEYYEYQQVYFNEGEIYTRQAKNETKNRDCLANVDWQMMFAIPVYEVEEPEAEAYNTGDEEEIGGMDGMMDMATLMQFMQIGMQVLANIANQEIDGGLAVELVASVLDKDVKGKLENGEVSLYRTHDFAPAINQIFGILARDAKNQEALLLDTINDVMDVVKAEFGLTYEGDFTDWIFANLNKILYKEVENDGTGDVEKVSTTVEDVVAMLDEELAKVDETLTVEKIVNILLANVDLGFGTEEELTSEEDVLTPYEQLMAAYGKTTLQSLYEAFVAPMLDQMIMSMMGGNSANYNTGDETPAEPMIAYMDLVSTVQVLVASLPSSMFLSNLLAEAELVDANGNLVMEIKKLSYYAAVVANEEGEFKGFDLELAIKANVAGVELANASIRFNLRVEKIADKSQLEQVDVTPATVED